MGRRAQDLRCTPGADPHPSSHRARPRTHDFPEEEGGPRWSASTQRKRDPHVHKWVTLPLAAPVLSEGLTWHLYCKLSRAERCSRLICYNSHPRSQKGELERLQPRGGGGLGELSVPAQGLGSWKSHTNPPRGRPEPPEDAGSAGRGCGGQGRPGRLPRKPAATAASLDFAPRDTAQRRPSPRQSLGQTVEPWAGSFPGDRPAVLAWDTPVTAGPRH